jgi:multidrug efflux pump subunit AcrA (membrane-fusion protein)
MTASAHNHSQSPARGSGKCNKSRFQLPCFVIVFVACGSDRSATVTTGAVEQRATLAQGEINERVLLTGELRAGVAIDLTVPKTETWELTIRWMAEDGAVVKAGDRVLEFDNSAFTTGLVQKQISVIEANSAFRTYRDVSAMALSTKRHELEQITVNLEKAKLLASVPADLLPQRTVQDRQLEKTRAELALVKADKDFTTEGQATALEAKVKQIELDKAKRAVDSAEKAIAELVLKAPRDGVISIGTHPWEGRRFQIGDTVQPGFIIVTLPDFTQPMEVKAELSDVDDGRVSLGQNGKCTLDAYPQEPLPCEVKELAPVARARQRQSLRRNFAVSLSIPNKDPDRMRPGMSVKIELTGKKIAGLLECAK